MHRVEGGACVLEFTFNFLNIRQIFPLEHRQYNVINLFVRTLLLFEVTFRIGNCYCNIELYSLSILLQLPFSRLLPLFARMVESVLLLCFVFLSFFLLCYAFMLRLGTPPNMARFAAILVLQMMSIFTTVSAWHGMLFTILNTLVPDTSIWTDVTYPAQCPGTMMSSSRFCHAVSF